MTVKVGSEFESGLYVESVILFVVVFHCNFNVK